MRLHFVWLVNVFVFCLFINIFTYLSTQHILSFYTLGVRAYWTIRLALVTAIIVIRQENVLRYLYIYVVMFISR